MSSFASTSTAVYPSALPAPPFPPPEDPCDACLLECSTCSPQPNESCCPLPFLPLPSFPPFYNDCQACSTPAPAGGGGPSPNIAGLEGIGAKSSHLAFCCDDEGCVPTTTDDKGKHVDRGTHATELGGGHSAWEQMLLDSCAQCVGDSHHAGPTPGGGGGHGNEGAPSLGLVDASCCSTPWLEGEGSLMDTFADCRSAGCFDLASPAPVHQSHGSGSSSSTDSLSTMATSVEGGNSRGNESGNVDLDGLLGGLDESTIQSILNCCCCEEVLHEHPANFDPSSHLTHQRLPQHIHCDEHHHVTPHQQHHFDHHSSQFLGSHGSGCPPPSATSPALGHHCGWTGCQLSFSSAEELALHVNTHHLALPAPSSADSSHSTANPSNLAELPAFPASSATTDSIQPHSHEAATAALKQVPLGQLAQLDPVTALAIFSSVFANRPGTASSHSGPAALPSPPLPTGPSPRGVPHRHQHSHSSRNSRRHVHSHPYGVASIRKNSHSHSVGCLTPTTEERNTSYPTPASQFVSSPSRSLPVSAAASPVPLPLASTSYAPPSPSSSSTSSHVCRWRSCGLAFATSADLMEHLSTDHIGSGKARYTCEWDGCERSTHACEERGYDDKEKDKKAFRQRQKVMRHLQMHTGDRPFSCDVCGKTFSESLTLTQHMRVHTQERPYACDHPGCNKTFALASALTIHKRTHSGDRPFICPHPGCSAAFAESSNLSKHIRTHGSERRYICDEVGCGKAFGRSDQLKRHRKTHERKRGKKQGSESEEMEL